MVLCSVTFVPHILMQSSHCAPDQDLPFPCASASARTLYTTSTTSRGTALFCNPAKDPTHDLSFTRAQGGPSVPGRKLQQYNYSYLIYVVYNYTFHRLLLVPGMDTLHNLGEP